MVIQQYPTTKKVQQYDDYHGTQVADPYRWLEDTDAPETRDWIVAQNRLTQSYLKDIPAKEYIRKRLTDQVLHVQYPVNFQNELLHCHSWYRS